MHDYKIYQIICINVGNKLLDSEIDGKQKVMKIYGKLKNILKNFKVFTKLIM